MNIITASKTQHSIHTKYNGRDLQLPCLSHGINNFLHSSNSFVKFAEYGMGSKVSAHGSDAYSFGIFLLEMFTGRRPTDEQLLGNFNLHNYIKMALPVGALKIGDRPKTRSHPWDSQEMKSACYLHYKWDWLVQRKLREAKWRWKKQSRNLLKQETSFSELN